MHMMLISLWSKKIDSVGDNTIHYCQMDSGEEKVVDAKSIYLSGSCSTEFFAGVNMFCEVSLVYTEIPNQKLQEEKFQKMWDDRLGRGKASFRKLREKSLPHLYERLVQLSTQYPPNVIICR